MGEPEKRPIVSRDLVWFILGGILGASLVWLLAVKPREEELLFLRGSKPIPASERALPAAK